MTKGRDADFQVVTPSFDWSPFTHEEKQVDLVARLVDRSLVVVAHTADGPRYGMLESVSAYCEQQLDSREHDLLRHAHAAYYTSLAEEAASHLCGPDQQRWLRPPRHRAATCAARSATTAARLA
ncbi:hypothetical protein WEI85_48170 [Actinomycetes bacterium KLBMP 9797]